MNKCSPGTSFRKIRYRVGEAHRMPYLYKLFSAKEPYNWWLFCGKRPATQGILCLYAIL